MSDLLNKLFEKDFTWEINDNPEFASQAGYHNIRGLQDLTLEGYQ